jgi:hypothetical protein
MSSVMPNKCGMKLGTGVRQHDKLLQGQRAADDRLKEARNTTKQQQMKQNRRHLSWTIRTRSTSAAAARARSFATPLQAGTGGTDREW